MAHEAVDILQAAPTHNIPPISLDKYLYKMKAGGHVSRYENPKNLDRPLGDIK